MTVLEAMARSAALNDRLLIAACVDGLSHLHVDVPGPPGGFVVFEVLLAGELHEGLVDTLVVLVAGDHLRPVAADAQSAAAPGARGAEAGGDLIPAGSL